MSPFLISRSHYKIALFIFIAVGLQISPVFAQTETGETDPIKIFNRGQDAHEAGDFKTAIKFYDAAVKITAEFPEAEYQRGNAYVSLGNFAEAEKAFRRAMELRENWMLPMTSLGGVLISTNRFAEAEKILNLVIKSDERNFPAYAALTELRLRTKAAPEVLKELLSKLVTLAAENRQAASLWAARGAIELNLGDKKAAESSLNNALKLEPNNSFALSERTKISLAENNFERAIADAKTLVVISPNSISAKLRLADAYAKSGNTSGALKILDDADESNAEVASLKNSILAASSEDVSALEKQLERDAKNASVLGRLCVLTRAASPQKAIDYCRRASIAEPNSVSHAVNFGAALVQAREFESAIGLFRKLLQIAPDNYTIHANLATALFESKRYPEAKSEYVWLSEKKPDLAIAYYFLAITYDRMEEYRNALANYQKFLSVADDKQNRLEIDKVNLRLPAVQKLVKQKGNK